MVRKDLIKEIMDVWFENVPHKSKHVFIFELGKKYARVSEVNKENGEIYKEFKTMNYYILEERKFGRYKLPSDNSRLRYYLLHRLKQK